MAITLLRKFPLPDALDQEPDVALAGSLRSPGSPIVSYTVTLDADPILTEAGFQLGYTGTALRNGFLGYDFRIVPTTEFPLDSSIPHTLEVAALNSLGDTLDEVWSFTVRDPAYDTLSLAVPYEIRRRDPALLKYLAVWDGIAAFARARTLDKVADRGLFDPYRIPTEFLQAAFESQSLVYPDFDEVSLAKRYRLLANADEVHSRRYCAPGLQFYVSLLTDAAIDVGYLNIGFFFFFNSDIFGFPTLAQMDSSGTSNDTCNYFVGSRAHDIVVTIIGNLSDQMKAFLTETINRELPFSDRTVRVDFFLGYPLLDGHNEQFFDHLGRPLMAHNP
jgi:hypothetical protein